MSKHNLFKDFPEVSAKAWKQKIQFDLKGADYNETLVWESLEGIKVKPFYHADDIDTSKLTDLNTGSWNIGQVIFVGNAAAANKKAKSALEKGAESIVFIIPTQDTNPKDFLSDLVLEGVTVYFEFQFLSSSYVQELLSFIDDSKANIFLNIDIIGNLARSGNWYSTLKSDHELLDDIVLNNKNSNLVSVDVSLYQNAGANLTQQLAYALAHANEYLNHFNTKEAVPKITFKISVGSNYFFEIAKLRALRLLWKTLSNEYGIDTDCHILALPTKRNKTLYDYNVNMLRTTTEAMSACLGGANTICNLPYDAIYHKENDFGDRIARNQLLVLKKESYFDVVDNPSDGSYYIETLTHQLAEKALDIFKNIEANGGFLSQLKANTIQKKIKESALKEQELFNTRKEVLVGTNKYVNDADKMKNDLELYPFVKTNPRKTLIEPIIEKRLAEELEQKRLKDE